MLNLQPEMYPAPRMWENNAFQDGGLPGGALRSGLSAGQARQHA